MEMAFRDYISTRSLSFLLPARFCRAYPCMVPQTERGIAVVVLLILRFIPLCKLASNFLTGAMQVSAGTNVPNKVKGALIHCFAMCAALQTLIELGFAIRQSPAESVFRRCPAMRQDEKI